MKKREVAVSARTLKTEDRYGLGKLCFATAMGLASTADHRWPSAHHPARYTARANPPRHLPGAARARTHPFAKQTMDPK
jgi:hypothetical protein